MDMRWIYFYLGVFALAFAILVVMFEPSSEKGGMLRTCIAGAVVNFTIFVIMGWAKRKGEKNNSLR